MRYYEALSRWLTRYIFEYRLHHMPEPNRTFLAEARRPAEEESFVRLRHCLH